MNTTHRGLAAAALVGALSLAGLTGCAASGPSEQENAAAACTALADYDATLTAAAADLSEATTVGELRDIRETVAAAHEAADEALGAVADDRAEALQGAWSTFSEQLQSVDDDASLADARDSLVEDARALAGARETAESGLNCG
ncbi:hypothetical protein [Leucobacter luti]|uniref:Uncharacterized protein n=1 Tax=Leucobacter luti TaxID=340320 RepID=A0A4Q7U5X5_9MICO|nr:hypothetical protein [Leucobacter luti]MBL3700773.1 hypothetical protein [Leucobacter luti]RZT68390.1 hypothetical protein EV139_0113 [Leucobacter luti]